MADISDVLSGLRDAIAAILYPSGVPSGAMPVSAANAPVRILVGWPDASIDQDLAKNIVWVTIWPRAGMARSVGPYMTGWQEAPRATPSMTAGVAGEAAIFSGTGTVPQMIAAVIVDRATAYTYALQPGDGQAEVAAALAALVSADRTASASNGVLTIPGAFSLVARVVAGGNEHREIRRLSQSIQIDVWAPSPTLRDAVARLVDEAMIEEYRTLDMPDGTKATISYEGTGFDEAGRQQPLHRRTIAISVEYSQARVRSAPAIAVPDTEYRDLPNAITRTILS